MNRLTAILVASSIALSTSSFGQNFGSARVAKVYHQVFDSIIKARSIEVEYDVSVVGNPTSNGSLAGNYPGRAIREGKRRIRGLKPDLLKMESSMGSISVTSDKIITTAGRYAKNDVNMQLLGTDGDLVPWLLFTGADTFKNAYFIKIGKPVTRRNTTYQVLEFQFDAYAKKVIRVLTDPVDNGIYQIETIIENPKGDRYQVLSSIRSVKLDVPVSADSLAP